ncbi:uncharacterized protein LODBEIA_P40710 [Lodderomyces beijingensis]|uniref:Uncharacterized protein n=1 Tax=Lodderomyces beijingensis TaxID=1775926 RepID=A0ABP0ZR78_9ASCO
MTSSLKITDLGEDILTFAIAQYLTPEQTFKFFTLNKLLYEIYDTSNTIYQLLYNKKFTNNENNYTLSLKDQINWKQLFLLRCNPAQQVFTWGESNGGRLGYLSTRIDQSHVSKKLGGWSVHTPTNIAEFNNHLVVDLKANGYSFIILLNNGELWFTGMDWKRPQQGLSTPGPISGKDYKPNPGTTALLSISRNNQDDNIGGRRNLRRDEHRHHNHGNGRFGVMPIPLMGMRYSQDSSSSSGDDNDDDTQEVTNEGSSSLQDLPQSRRKLQPPSPPLTHPPSNIQETNFLSRLFLPPPSSPKSMAGFVSLNSKDARKLVSISTGREHIIALDNHNNIYTWDAGCNSNIGIKVKFQGISNKLLINKIAAGWNLSSCLIDNVGLVVWYTRKPTTREQFESQEFECEASYIVIPHTNNDVVDFTVGADYVLYIKKSDSRLYQFRFNAHEFASRDADDVIEVEELNSKVYPMANFNTWLDNQVENVQFTRLNSCMANFVVFTNHDQVLIGLDDHLQYVMEDEPESSAKGSTPIIIPQLQGQNIKSIEIGDYHYLALTNDGAILSWGTESRSCGCLGIGARELALEEHPTTCFARGANLELESPMKVKDPYRSSARDSNREKGKWVCIAASGWHSGGVYVPNEE